MSLGQVIEFGVRLVGYGTAPLGEDPALWQTYSERAVLPHDLMKNRLGRFIKADAAVSSPDVTVPAEEPALSHDPAKDLKRGPFHVGPYPVY